MSELLRRMRAGIRARWQVQQRLWEGYDSRFDLSGGETLEASRRMRWVDDRLYGDRLPPDLE